MPSPQTGKLKLYRIDWLDHCSLVGRRTWFEFDEALELTPSFITSVGYIIKETKKYIILVSTITDTNDVSGVRCILKSCIVKRKNLGH